MPRERRKYRIDELPVSDPPLPPSGGRIFNSAGEFTPFANDGEYHFGAYIEFLATDGARKRGNHYHINKTETLYIIKGELSAIYFDLDTGEKDEVDIREGNLITIQPRCAHVYIPRTYSQAVELGSHAYSPNDTVSYELQT